MEGLTSSPTPYLGPACDSGCLWAGFGMAITLMRGKSMHLEFLIEDSSGERLLQALLPKLLGESGESHTWRLHAYKGIGRVPKGIYNLRLSYRS